MVGHMASRRKWHHLRPAAIVALGLYVAWTVVATPPLGPVVPWVWLGLLALLGVLGIPGSRLLRSPAPLLLLLFWAVWAATLPITTAWAPQARQVTRELWSLYSAVAISITLVLLSRGGRKGLPVMRSFDIMWVAVFVTTLSIAVWEVVTTDHLLVTASRTWLPPPRSPAATFINPNNYACVLVVVMAIALLWATERRLSRLGRVLLVLVAAGCVGAAALTDSRAAYLAFAVQAGLALMLWVVRGGVVARFRKWAARHRLVAGGLVLAGLAVVAAPFVVPALAARNPLLFVLQPAYDDEAQSDALRLRLTKVGVRYWLDNPWFGTGAGSYEVRLSQDHPAGITMVTNMHNAFVELLAQYGSVVTLPFALLLAVLLWLVVRPMPRLPGGTPAPATGHDATGLRYRLAALLVGIAVAGVTVSSALSWGVWWVMIAHATAIGWTLHNEAGARRGARRAAKAARAAPASEAGPPEVAVATGGPDARRLR